MNALNNEELNKIAFNGEIKVVNSNINMIGKLPFLNEEIYFLNDIWEFENTGVKKKYEFTNICSEYKNYVKEYVLELLLNGFKAYTIKKYFLYIKKIARFLESNKIYNCEIIDKNTITKFNEYINENLITENERNHHRRLLSKLLTYIEYDKGVNYSDIKKILANNDTALLKAQIENGKTPKIPEEIFDKIISCGISELNSDTIEIDEKIGACAILLLSQIGMRIMELNLLEAGKRKEIDCFDGKNRIAYLEFKTFKTTRSNNGATTKTFLTKIADLAYKKLESMTDKRRNEGNSNYLFLTNKKLRMDQSTLSKYITKFMLRNAKELELINKSYDGFKMISKRNKDQARIFSKYINFLEHDEYISVPKSHQFRVTVCNKLIKEGVQFGWVVEHMNHLSPEMTKHYIREDKAENIELSRKFFKGVLTSEFKPIGEQAEQLVKKIDEFVEDSKFNIKKDLDEIIDYLAGKVPIREKIDGFCIKSAFGKKCKYNEFMCAFDMCPNHISCFINADITYGRFINKVKVIKYNEDNNFKREAMIEKTKLKKLINRSLEAELQELKNEINKHGEIEIIKDYPKLKNIVKDIDSIIMEVENWKTKN